jgi:hypothetical protein
MFLTGVSVRTGPVRRAIDVLAAQVAEGVDPVEDGPSMEIVDPRGEDAS